MTKETIAYAAINSGNSGGPAFNDKGKCVGIAFQSLKHEDAENIGYLIPTPVILHFIHDYEKNGSYTGFPILGVEWQKMENPDLRSSMGMKTDQKGVRVRRVEPTAPESNVLLPSDVILSFDGVNIANDGTVPFRHGERIGFSYLVSQKYTGDNARVKVLRSSEILEFNIKLAVSVPYLRSEYGKEYEFDAPVKLLDKLLHAMAESVDEQLDVVSQLGWRSILWHREEALYVFEERQGLVQAYGKDSDKVFKWRQALKEIANLSGWDIENKPESVVIEEIVRKVFNEVNFELPSEYPSLVGMGSRAGGLKIKLLGSPDDVLVVGIPEMGGVGKTTIARVVYDTIRFEFDGCSFLANVSEISKKRGIEYLQEQLLRDILKDKKTRVNDVYQGVSMIKKSLSSRKVLVVLDDVAESDQLAALAGNFHWFGPGSRVIITTRDQHLLFQHGVGEFFHPEKLDHDESLHLFSLRAFKRDRPPEMYLELSNEVVSYTGGLPLALTVLGSFLFGRSVDEWKSMLNRLKTTPVEKITNTLKISFDGLQEKEKKMFLDIACFFKGENKNRVMKIWDGCGFDPDIGVRVLLDKFLISIRDDQELWMHDLLQQMGWEIVCRESPMELGGRSRLWNTEDIRYVLRNDKGSELVEGLFVRDTNGISSTKIEALDVDAKTFRKMNRLRLLKLEDVDLSGDLRYLSGEIRFLHWDSYQKKSLPDGFQSNKLVDLGLRHSLIEKLSLDEKPMENLKYLDLSHSTRLIDTPDFSLLPNLEELLLVGCVGLYRLHPSIGLLVKLVMLNLSGCRNLLELPSSISGLCSLKYLDLFACSKLAQLPEAICHLQCLEELDLGHTMIHPPYFLTRLKNLKGLSFSGCEGQLSQTWHSFISSFFRKRDSPETS
ncbi:hypothetical protein MLD38_001157 [Melastoma candidum]|uniref:Uncharacterized protein n=1 Tax=Melastoma candidum TaxID=119954 RepID=A0ACB9SFN5_9MYRT|nr:hypothetical protein MLD38_001157 [Melastoma candidum]